jgi:hypothetical protein
MTTLPPSDPSVQFTPLAREGAWREGRASLKPAGKAAQLSWRSVMALLLLALATAHIPQPAAAQTCTAPPNCKAQGKALTWNGTAWECMASSKGLSIQGYTYTNYSSYFNVSNVISNTLLPSNPGSSSITLVESGNYFLMSTQYTCYPGSWDYAGSYVIVNGAPVAHNSSRPGECASSSTAIFFPLNAGDVVGAACYHLQNIQTLCSFTVIKL